MPENKEYTDGNYYYKNIFSLMLKKHLEQINTDEPLDTIMPGHIREYIILFKDYCKTRPELSEEYKDLLI